LDKFQEIGLLDDRIRYGLAARAVIIYFSYFFERVRTMKSKVVILMLGVLLCAGGLARGELITIEIEAVVDTVEDDGPGDGYLNGQINPGDIITGYYCYESTTPDSNPFDSVGDYWHYSSPYGIFLSVGGFNFQTDPDNVQFLVEIVNDNAGLDAYVVHSYNNLSISGGTIVEHISWQLDDSTQMVLTDTILPTIAPNLDDWQSNHLCIAGERTFGIWAHVTSAVPEPATILLLGLGGLFLRKRN